MCGCNQEVKSVYCGEGDCIPDFQKNSELDDEFDVNTKCSNCNFKIVVRVKKKILVDEVLHGLPCLMCDCNNLIKDF